MSVRRRDSREHGFTLIELLVAMFLLAVLGTAGFQMLFQINIARDTIEAQADRLNSLQRTFYWLAEDITQVIDRPIRSAVDAALPGFQVNIQGDSLFEFSRAGWTNPAADVSPPRSSLQRVSYSLDGDRLMRNYWYHLETIDETPTRRRQLLDKVDDMSLRFLATDGEFHESWPPPELESPGLPGAIEITLELQDFGTVIRLFGLPG